RFSRDWSSDVCSSDLDTSHLPLKLNTAGVIPPIFASSLLLLPATLAGFADTTQLPGWAATILATLGHGQPLYMFLYAAMIMFFRSEERRVGKGCMSVV